LYVTRAWDFLTGNFYQVSSRTISGGVHTVQLVGSVPPTSTLVVSVLVQDTAQLAFNAPVKAATSIEETVLAGNFTSDSTLTMDPRVKIISVGFDSTANVSTVVLAADG